MSPKIPDAHKPKGVYLTGLTGGIASGKTFATDEFTKLGAYVIDADVSARNVVIPGSPGLKGIVEIFGRDVLKPSGVLDREKLADIIFQFEHKRIQLEDLLHPLIKRHEIKQLRLEWKTGRRGVFVVSAALMIEAGSYWRYDTLAVVWCTKAQQAKRLRKRDGFSRKEALSRIESQMPLREKKKYAGVVIDNAGTKAETKKQIRQLYKDWKKLARKN